MVAVYTIRTVLTLLLAVVAWEGGRRLGARPGRARSTATVIGMILAIGGAAFEIKQTSVVVGGLDFSALVVACGGGYPACCCGALLLIAIVWGAPERTVRPRFLLLGVVSAVLVQSTALTGFVWWPLMPRTMANYPDADGLLQQTTGTTCTAAAGAMLTARSGLRYSEGQVAQFANTSPLLGSKPLSLAVGLDRAVRRQGYRCRSALLTWEQCLALHRPLVIAIYLPQFGLWHSVLLDRMDEAGAWVADPLQTDRERLSRADIEARWHPFAVWLTPGT